MKAPTYDAPRVLPEVVQGPRASPEAFGAGVARGVQALGEQVQRSAQVGADQILRFQQEKNETAAYEAAMEYTLRASALETEFMSMQGNQPAQAYPDFVKRVQELRDEVIQRAPNVYTRRLIDRATGARFENLLVGASRHASTQNRQYMSSQAEAQATLAAEDMVRGGAERIGINQAEIYLAAYRLQRLNGWSDEDREIFRSRKNSEGLGNHILTVARTNPMEASRLIREYSAELNADTRIQVETAVTNYLNTVGVDQAKRSIMEGEAPAMEGDFWEIMAQKESSGIYSNNKNPDYKGRWQFGLARLDHLGVLKHGANWNSVEFQIPGFPEVKNLSDFLNKPEAQDKVLAMHDALLEKEIKANGFAKYEGQVIDGVTITHNGLKAMMHLGGVKGARKFLTGVANEDDNLGTTVRDYAILGAKGLDNRFQEGMPLGGITYNTTETEFVKIAQAAREWGLAVQPNNPQFADNLVSGLTTEYDLLKKVHAEQVKATFDSAYRAVLPDPKTMEGPTTLSPELLEVWPSLEASQQNTILGQLKENANPETQRETQEQLNNYYKILGMRSTDPEGFKKLNLAEAPIATKRKASLMDEQTKPLTATEQATDISELMDDLAPILTPLELSDDQRSVFVGRLSQAVEFYKAENDGRKPKDIEVQQIAAQLLNKVVVRERRGWFDDTARTFELPTPEEAALIRQKYPKASDWEVYQILQEAREANK